MTFGIAYLGGNRYSTPDLANMAGVILQPAVEMPDLVLQDQSGERFSRAQLTDHWSLLLLDPTPGLASPGLRRLIQVHNRLADNQALQTKSRFVYLPMLVDEADIKALTRLGGNFVTLQGEPAAVNHLFEELGVSETQAIAPIYLIDPTGKLRVLFTESLDAATIAADITTLITQYR
jgi:cytochrome oxidase Cu insertion factor (SCO1/SenC/PrrC family)